MRALLVSLAVVASVTVAGAMFYAQSTETPKCCVAAPAVSQAAQTTVAADIPRVAQPTEAELLAAERAAREARLGVWGEAAYEVRSADASAALLRHAATFQVIEGRVARVAITRGSIYLNFEQGRRRGFSASLRLGDRTRLGSFQDNPKGLEQTLVRVRGWIEERDGQPRMDLSAAGSIEVLDGGPMAGRAEHRSPAK